MVRGEGRRVQSHYPPDTTGPTSPCPSEGPRHLPRTILWARGTAGQPHATPPTPEPRRATPGPGLARSVLVLCVVGRSLVAGRSLPGPFVHRIPFSFQRGRLHLRAARRAATMENMKWLHFDLGGSKMLHFMFGGGARGPAPLPGRMRQDPGTASTGPPGPSRTLENPPGPSRTL